MLSKHRVEAKRAGIPAFFVALRIAAFMLVEPAANAIVMRFEHGRLHAYVRIVPRCATS